LGIVVEIGPQKQHLALIQALGTLRLRCPSLAFCLKIIGASDGLYAQAVRELIKQLKLQDVVEWSGFKANRDDYIP